MGVISFNWIEGVRIISTNDKYLGSFKSFSFLVLHLSTAITSDVLKRRWKKNRKWKMIEVNE